MNQTPLQSIVLLGLFSSLAALSTDIYLPALSEMGESLSASQYQIQLTLAIFFFGYGFGQLLFGPLSDSFGRRRVMLLGLYTYTAASVLCVFSINIEMLIVSRFLQAIGGCSAAVTARAIIRDTTSGVQTAKALSVVMAVIQVGPLIAPPIGGIILLFAQWQGVFVALALYGVICTVFAHKFIEESHPLNSRQSFNIANILRGYIHALSHLPITLLIVAEVAASVVLLTFVTGASLIFVDYYQLSPQQFSGVFSLVATGLILGSFVNNRFVVKIGVTKIIAMALGLGFVACAMMAAAVIFAPKNLYALIGGLWLCLVPCALVRSNYVALGLQYMPERTGVVAALFGSLSLGLGGVAAIVIGSLDYYGPAQMVSFMIIAFTISALFYLLWRVYYYQEA